MRGKHLVYMTPSELAITNAIEEIENLGADVRLTNAQLKLQEARSLVEEYMDEKIKEMLVKE